MLFSDLPGHLQQELTFYRAKRIRLQNQAEQFRARRDALARELVAVGLSLRQVANLLNVSHEQVRQSVAEPLDNGRTNGIPNPRRP